jgi:SWI/SNF-related matrix-associated actin-dependent regulator 1 of chromatin subfamily A
VSEIELRQYQVEAASFLLEKKRAILGDEPGMGKTFPAIEAAQRVSPNEKKLVVAPSYLLRKWRDDIVLRCGDVDVRIVGRTGEPIEREYSGWIVTNYHTFLNGGIQKRPELLRLTWGAVIFDESHRLRGRKAQWTVQAMKLKTEHKFFLTGTPIVNNPGDLFPILKMIDSRTFSSYWRFIGDWCVTEQDPWTTKIHGIKPELEPAFNTMLEPYMLRRTYDTVIEEAVRTTGVRPAWTEQPVTDRIYVPLPKAMKKAHDVAKKEWFLEHPDLEDAIAIKNGGALVAKLRQLTAGFMVQDGSVVGVTKENPKVEAAMGFLEDHPDEPSLIFCWYRGTCQRACELLAALGRPVFQIDGGTSAAQREERLEQWRKTHNGIIVATLASLTEGANLQHSKRVIFLEHDYLPGVLDQAVARVRRFGQEFRVHVVHILAEDTIDEAVYRTAQTRNKNIHKALLERLRDL